MLGMQCREHIIITWTQELNAVTEKFPGYLSIKISRGNFQFYRRSLWNNPNPNRIKKLLVAWKTKTTVYRHTGVPTKQQLSSILLSPLSGVCRSTYSTLWKLKKTDFTFLLEIGELWSNQTSTVYPITLLKKRACGQESRRERSNAKSSKLGVLKDRKSVV